MRRPNTEKLEEKLFWQMRLAENIDQNSKRYFFIERKPAYDAVRITSMVGTSPFEGGVSTRIIYDHKEFGYQQRAPMLRHIREYLLERDVVEDEKWTRKFEHVTLTGRLRRPA